MTVQLATRVDPKIRIILEKLHKKTRLPIRQLTEKAILLLEQHYQKLQSTHSAADVDDHFVELLEYSMKKYDKVYKALAK